MNRLFDDDEEESPPARAYTRSPGRPDPGAGAEREISLGLPAILGIFFALALVCACFFGFGYTMGRKLAQAAPVDTSTANVDTSSGVSQARRRQPCRPTCRARRTAHGR